MDRTINPLHWLCLGLGVASWCVAGVVGASPSASSSVGDVLGIKRAAIYRGRPATQAELYSTIVMVNANEDDPAASTAFCTGTLIAPQVVLTAAHCFITEKDGKITGRTDASTFRVYAGHLNTNAMSFDGAVVVSKAVPHPQYPNTTVAKDDLDIGREDDVAILLLAKPITNIPVAPIMSAEIFNREMTANRSLIVNGYGLTGPTKEDGGVLHIAEMPFQETKEAEFWAGGSTVPDTCPGDSGGPSYLKVGEQVYLVGVGMRGINRGNAKCGEGAIFARAHLYIDWIQANSDGLYDPNAAPKPKEGCGCTTQDATPVRLPVSLAALLLLFGFLLRRRFSHVTHR